MSLDMNVDGCSYLRSCSPMEKEFSKGKVSSSHGSKSKHRHQQRQHKYQSGESCDRHDRKRKDKGSQEKKTSSKLKESRCDHCQRKEYRKMARKLEKACEEPNSDNWSTKTQSSSSKLDKSSRGKCCNRWSCEKERRNHHECKYCAHYSCQNSSVRVLQPPTSDKSRHENSKKASKRSRKSNVSVPPNASSPPVSILRDAGKHERRNKSAHSGSKVRFVEDCESF